MTIEQVIEKYPKIFQDYEGNPYRVNWYGVPDGWVSIVDILCGAIQHYIDNVTTYSGDEIRKPKQITCTQIKEKYAELRFYADNTDDIIEGMIRMAQYMSEHTCQDCGSEKDLGMTSGWLSVVCKTCNKDNTNWKPLVK